MIEILASIETPPNAPKPFSAGIVLWDDRVVEAAPILRKLFAKRSRDYVRDHCKRVGWKITVVHQIERPDPYKAPDIRRGER